VNGKQSLHFDPGELLLIRRYEFNPELGDQSDVPRPLSSSMATHKSEFMYQTFITFQTRKAVMISFDRVE
jgi:hypothetical protein